MKRTAGRSELVHVIRKGVLCGTEKRGQATRRDASPARIVVDASAGFIPLWAEGTTLRWRFQERSFRHYEDPDAAKAYVEELFGRAVLAWGDAVPVQFAKREDAWDFEIVMSGSDDCDPSGGCVLASAFFPDAGQHELWVYPKMFKQVAKEQVETLVHEIGHVFGLRHFFANISERRWRSEIFGEHKPFSIMNYGEQSVLTETDRSDLKRLYRMAWDGSLTEINGTPIRLVRPFHTLRGDAGDLMASDRNVATATVATATAPGGRFRAPSRLVASPNRFVLSFESKQDIEDHVVGEADRRIRAGATVDSAFGRDLGLQLNAVKVFIREMIDDLEAAGLTVNATPQSLASQVKTIGDLVNALAEAAGLE
jgi:hypothetical protein